MSIGSLVMYVAALALGWSGLAANGLHWSALLVFLAAVLNSLPPLTGPMLSRGARR